VNSTYIKMHGATIKKTRTQNTGIYKILPVYCFD